MSEYKLKKTKVEEKVVDTYKKIEDGVVNDYKNVEDNGLEPVAVELENFFVKRGIVGKGTFDFVGFEKSRHSLGDIAPFFKADFSCPHLLNIKRSFVGIVGGGKQSGIVPDLLDAKLLLMQDFARFGVGKDKADIVAKRLFQTCGFGVEYADFHIIISFLQSVRRRAPLLLYHYSTTAEKVKGNFQIFKGRLDELRLTLQKEKRCGLLRTLLLFGFQFCHCFTLLAVGFDFLGFCFGFLLGDFGFFLDRHLVTFALGIEVIGIAVPIASGYRNRNFDDFVLAQRIDKRETKGIICHLHHPFAAALFAFEKLH